MNSKKKKLVIGISGASGAPVAVELLKTLQSKNEIELHLVITKSAELTLRQECNLDVIDLKQYVQCIHSNEEIGAVIASGSYQTIGMIVVPCSMKTVAGIASGYSDNLLLRAADVCLKERRKLILVVRESPLSSIHLKNLYELSTNGAIIMPPMLTFYNNPETVNDCIKYTVERILSHFNLDGTKYVWEGC